MSVITCQEYRTLLQQDAESSEPLLEHQYQVMDEHDNNCAPCRMWADQANPRSKP